jgi:C4-dicarboxylate-binding protein DctP
MMGLFDFPYYWPSDREALIKLHNSDAVGKLLDTTTQQGIYSMAVWHTGYKEWTANAPLTEPEAYEGLRSRVMPSAVLVAQQKSLGLTPVDMPFPETYSALQSGAIDAQENPVATSYSMKFYEVQSDVIMTNHGNLDQIFMVSKAWWDGLTPECQGALSDAVADGQKVVVSETERVEAIAMEAFKEEGVNIVTPTPEQIQALREKTLPAAHAAFLEATGDEGEAMINTIQAAIDAL